MFLFFFFLFRFQLFQAPADQFLGGGGTAGISVFKTEIVDPAQKLLIHDDGITGFFCGPGIPSLDFMIQRFMGSVKQRVEKFRTYAL